MTPKLTPEARDAALATLPGWRHDPARDTIARSFTFADFGAAFAFMTRVALLAEQADHHPEWCNVWNRVDIVLTTHDCAGLSQRDVTMARRIDGIAG
jgi:4a-hydroxytetrahydrobiopterin dehydratase